MKKCFGLGIFSLLMHVCFAQQDSTQSRNLVKQSVLQEVVVKAYEQNRSIIDVPAAVAVIGQAQLDRYSNSSILPALNTIPGVRMEERSPASYRLNFRGSSLRSPFGVRDVKIYFNEIPLTDPSGNTYLNQLGFYNFQSMEIIKGPASSLYGAGIGGALLINSMPSLWQKGVSADYSPGSFGAESLNGTVRWGTEDHRNIASYSHQNADGYRVQSAMRRDVASWETMLKVSEKQRIHAYILYSDLYYQTPGGLTLAEYNKDPREARPMVGTTPGAVQNKAAIFQKIFTAGFSNEYFINDNWKNTSSAYGAYTNFHNPSIRVYEVRNEPHFGGRTVFEYKKKIPAATIQLDFGAEAQKGFFTTTDYANKGGVSGALQTNYEIGNYQYMIFAQADAKLQHGWTITAGASFNKSAIQFTSRSSSSPVTQTQDFSNRVAPRFAVLKKIMQGISVYASASRGFSAPTVSELVSSAGNVGYNLQPEDGIDYEAGLKISLLKNRLAIDLNSFFFHLKNTIVQRIDSNQVYYYVNAGSTRQNGFEAAISYLLLDKETYGIRNVRVWSSYTLHRFHYHVFKELTADYSGNQLPGVAPNTVVAGLDIASRIGVYTNITYTYNDPMPLNDANTAYAHSYNLMALRLGYRQIFKRKLGMDLFGGIDNLFNVKYSLGNDINAALNRFYNGAPGINYYAGISLSFASH